VPTSLKRFIPDWEHNEPWAQVVDLYYVIMTEYELQNRGEYTDLCDRVMKPAIRKGHATHDLRDWSRIVQYLREADRLEVHRQYRGMRSIISQTKRLIPGHLDTEAHKFRVKEIEARLDEDFDEAPDRLIEMFQYASELLHRL
jgi:hypothetical protein